MHDETVAVQGRSTPGTDIDPLALLEAGNVESIAPTSYAQQRLWFFEQLHSGSPIYNVEHFEMLSGPLDMDALQATLNDVVRRHEALRTTFRNVRGTPIQVIHPPAPVAIARVDMTARQAEQQGRDVKRFVDGEIGRGFALDGEALVRFTLIELEARRQMLLLVAHHIVFDLWSSGVFAREFATLYDDFRTGRASSIADPMVRYSAFVAAQRLRFDAAGHDPQTDYWRARLADLPASTEFPSDRPRPAVQTYSGAIKTFYIPPDVAEPFRNLTRTARSTLFMSLFAAYAIVLHRCTGQADLAVGTPIANRGRPELGAMIGFLLNMLVLRIGLGDDPTVTGFLARAREMAVEAFDNQDAPFEFLIEDMKPKRDPARSPMFQTMFVYQPARGVSDASTDEGHAPTTGSKFDLTLTIKDAMPGMGGALEYNTDLFDPTTMDRLAGHFVCVLTAMAARPDARISTLPLLAPAERQKILVDWNRTNGAAPPKVCLHNLFERVAAERPDALAVCFGADVLTYGDLESRAAILAGALRARGAGPDVRIGICMGRSLDWIIAIFATLKSGGAMVPLDVSFPAERLRYMMEDASLAIVLSQGPLAGKLAGTSAEIICLDAPLPSAARPTSTAARPVAAEDLAYVVYTSGSTGKPKGVLVQHDGAVNFVVAQIAAWAIGPGARVLQFTAFGFDIGLSEIFMTLCSGATFFLASAADLRAGPPLLATLRSLRITHVTLPPSALAAMQPDTLPDLQLLISAGEPCEADLAWRWAPGRRIVNAYGPTEATIYATVGDLDPVSGKFPLGRPIANVQVYVLDRHGEPVPPGVTGEIHIGGIGVARGYLNRPDMTAERFIPDRLSGRSHANLYKTGDLGRFDAAGVLHYLGRVDFQLKIRGYRVEPGEIESVLRQHASVADALVLGHGSGPDARLLAFVIPADPPPLVIELRSFLARHLPDYMAPSAYVMVAAWPKTANGKIDRAVLPRPDSLSRDVATVFVAPGNAMEQVVAGIWRDCLEVEQVGATDNFFDLGGHSLLLVRVYDQLKAKLKVELSLIDMFRFPTVKSQADMLEAKVSNRIETQTLGHTNQRAARQNAARLQRRQRIETDRHA